MPVVLQDWILKFLTDFLDTGLSFVLHLFVTFTNISTAFLESTIVVNAVGYAQKLGTVLLVLKLISDIYKGYMSSLSGEKEMKPSGYVVRGVAALLIIWTLPYIIRELVKIGNYITDDIASLSGVPVDPTTAVSGMQELFRKTIEPMANNTTYSAFMAMFGGLFGAVIAVCLVMIMFSFAKRSIEIGIMAIIGPVFTVNMASEDTSLYKNWLKHLIVLTASQALQILMLRFTFFTVTHGADLFMGAGAMSLLMIMALLIFTVKIPKFLEQFTYGTGGNGGGGAIAHVASSAIGMLGKVK
jgi:hypothetical protein